MSTNLRIREQRKKAGLTLNELADKIGVSTPHLSEMERGIKNISAVRLEQIATALNLETVDLLDQDDQSRLLLEILRELTPNDRNAVINHASALLRSGDKSNTH